MCFAFPDPTWAKPPVVRRTPQATRAGNIQDRDPKEIQKSALAFTHELKLGAIPTLPATITLDSEEPEIKQIRALAVIDGKLLTVPLSYSRIEKHYIGYLPTPDRTLSYRFQIFVKNGDSFLSDGFAADPMCYRSVLEQIRSADEKFPGQRDLLEQAVELKRTHLAVDYWKSILIKIYASSEANLVDTPRDQPKQPKPKAANADN